MYEFIYGFWEYLMDMPADNWLYIGMAVVLLGSLFVLALLYYNAPEGPYDGRP